MATDPHGQPGMIAVCRHCGHKVSGQIVERPGDWLVRCPDCDAYDWEPPPLVVGEDGLARERRAS